ncbi:regulator of microtubule dynamics protein 2 isoform X2 [Nannospalax galili]|uniref:regulator of microtubule dynamics protein 2 isoform X2 n=1 Tax=Nannospalax galili TaxID=1026970 RepID=UPI00111C2A16|nr:regulator of microtubule dynamics protein 2 isoform X2 [Nannospalax galili]
MGKCLSCCKEDQSFHLNYIEDQVNSDHKHHGASYILKPKLALGLVTCHPSSTSKPSRKVSSTLYASNCSFLSGGRQSLLTKLQKRNNFPWRQQSRTNFDFHEDITVHNSKSSDHFGAVGTQKCFSSHKLSIVSCYRRATFLDTSPNSQNMPNANENQDFSKKSVTTSGQKRIRFSDPEYSSKYFTNFETKAVSPGHWAIERDSFQPSLTSVFSLPTVISSSSQINGFASSSEENQLNKDSEDALHHRSQSHSPNYHPAASQRLLSQNVAFSSFQNIGLSLPYKNADDFQAAQIEVTSGPFEQENFAAFPQDEDRPPPIEIAEIRYITANTDTEEQSFPVPKAFNTYIEELNLDILLQKVDHLRLNEAGKTESFELLCDHKEKFNNETEFMWRLARAYGDMYELSTNKQEKKYYANVGKTLGERAITKAPLNGHCHLWYAVLCGHVSEFEGLQNKINCGHLFKEHLDIAIQLLPEEPFLYYLKGRYCYTVSKLSWIEKKMAATLFGEIPSSTVHEALHNFLKTEELQPGYSMSNYMYMAKCYVDLEEPPEAWKFCNLALLLPPVTKEDKDAHKEVKKIISSLKR